MSNTAQLESMSIDDKFISPSFEFIMCTREDFEKNKSKFEKEGNFIILSDTGEELIYSNYDFIPVGNMNDTEQETRHREVKKCKCTSCNATLDLSTIPESGAIKCSYCGNWNLVYKE